VMSSVPNVPEKALERPFGQLGKPMSFFKYSSERDSEGLSHVAVYADLPDCGLRSGLERSSPA
jgi:hypothetical protein